jgi:hypothetical protein
MPKAMIVYTSCPDVEYYEKYIAMASTDCVEISDNDVKLLRRYMFDLEYHNDLTPTLVVFPEEPQKDFIDASLNKIKDRVRKLEEERIRDAEKRKAAAEKRKLEKAKKLAEKNKLSEEQELKLLEELKKKYQ